MNTQRPKKVGATVPKGISSKYSDLFAALERHNETKKSRLQLAVKTPNQPAQAVTLPVATTRPATGAQPVRTGAHT